MYSTSETMNDCFSTCVCMPVIISFRKRYIFKVTIYEGFIEGCTLIHCNIMPEYFFSIEISRNKISLISIIFWPLVEYFVA